MRTLYFKATVLILISYLIAGCGERKLDSKYAKEILMAQNDTIVGIIKQQNNNSYLNPILQNKPEFKNLNNNNYYIYEFHVNDVKIESDSTAKVDFIRITKPEKKNIQIWLEAYEKMKERLKDTKPVRKTQGNKVMLAFMDPADSLEFAVEEDSVGKSGNASIYNTNEWKEIEEIKTMLEGYMVAEEINKEDIKEQLLMKEGKTWKVIFEPKSH